jgi:hypothetical protein
MWHCDQRTGAYVRGKEPEDVVLLLGEGHFFVLLLLLVDRLLVNYSVRVELLALGDWLCAAVVHALDTDIFRKLFNFVKAARKL